MKSKQPKESETLYERIDRELAHMKHSDLQRECVLRGLEPKFIVEWDHHKLSNWFYHNYEKGQDVTKLAEYDIWMEQQLSDKGYKKGDAVMAPCFRLGFSPDIKEIKDINTPGVIKQTATVLSMVAAQKDETKPKRSVDESTGVVSGTKKNLTFQLSKKGLSQDEIIRQVLEAFPDAQEKSIKIWIKREKNGTK